MRHRISFVVGDWSGDGHQMNDSFTIESNKPVDDIREVHFSCIEKCGFDIGDICGDYEECSIDKEIADKIKSLGINIEDFPYDMSYWGPDEIVNLWVAILNKIDPSLELMVVDDKIPCMHFSGYDDKERHLNVPGYGCYLG